MHIQINEEIVPDQGWPLAVRVPDVLTYCPATGELRWLDRHDIPPHVNGRLVGRIAGSANARGYRYIGLDGHVLLASHVAFVLMTGRRPLHNVSHVDGDLSNLRWDNLREATDSELRVAQDKRAGLSSPYKGVSFSGGKKPWRAQIGSLGRCIDLGRYETEESAASAYIAAKATFHAPEVIGVAGKAVQS
jgi:hypothetical protein